MILGLQDRVTRDRAAEWMEGPEAEPALRLWRALARRCVAPTRSTLPRRSLWRAGSPGRWGTSPRPGWLSVVPCTLIPTTSSPGCCTRRATRGSTPSCFAGRSARSGRDARRTAHCAVRSRRNCSGSTRGRADRLGHGGTVRDPWRSARAVRSPTLRRRGGTLRPRRRADRNASKAPLFPRPHPATKRRPRRHRTFGRWCPASDGVAPRRGRPGETDLLRGAMRGRPVGQPAGPGRAATVGRRTPTVRASPPQVAVATGARLTERLHLSRRGSSRRRGQQGRARWTSPGAAGAPRQNGRATAVTGAVPSATVSVSCRVDHAHWPRGHRSG